MSLCHYYVDKWELSKGHRDGEGKGEKLEGNWRALNVNMSPTGQEGAVWRGTEEGVIR